jgi:hypothetical protein
MNSDKIKWEKSVRVPDPRTCLKCDLQPTTLALTTTEDIEAVAPFAAPVGLRSLRVSQQYYSAEIAAKLSIGAGFGSGSADSKYSYFAIRYEALLETVAEPIRVGDTELEKVGAIGVILDLTVQQSNSSVKLDIFSVAAAVQLGFAKAQYSTKVLPANNGALRAMVPEGGSFDVGNYETVISGVNSAKDALAAIASSLTPETYHRPSRILPTLQKELQFAQNVTFAIRYMAKGRTAATAAEDAVDKGLDGVVVRLVYEAYWPDLKDQDEPPREVISQARTWLADSFQG